MNRHYQDYRSHLFTVRLRNEELGAGQREWRGKVQHVHSGEAIYFREWPALVNGIINMLSDAEPLSARDDCNASTIDAS